MKNKNSRILRKLIASALIFLMVAAPVTPLGRVIGIDASITASAYNYTTVSTANELDNALSSGGNYILGEDITWTYDNTYPVVAPGATVRLNLGGHTLDIQSNEITSYGTLTIEGEGTITGNPYWRLIIAYADGSAGVVNLVSDDVDYIYTGRNALLDSGSGTINVSGGNFVSSSALYSGYGRINITGGTFNKDPSDKVPAGYKVRSVDGAYKVSQAINATADFSSITNAPAYIKVKNANNGTVVMSSIAGTNQYTCNLSDDYTVTSPYKLDFVGADVEEEQTDTGWTYDVTSVNEANVTVTKRYENEGTWWGLTTTGTLELFGQMPDTIVRTNDQKGRPWGDSIWTDTYKIKKVVALPGAKTGTNSLYYLFENHQYIEEIDLSELDTSQAVNMDHTFDGLYNYSTGGFKALVLDFTSWDVSNVTSMEGLFSECEALSINLSGWDVSKVTNMRNMFYQNYHITSLDLTGWDTSSVTNMSGMFGRTGFASTADITGWSALDTSSVTDMNYMFYESSFTTIDVSNFQTENVTNMNSMFCSCRYLENIVGLTAFDTASVVDMGYMFAYNTREIYDDYGDEVVEIVTPMKSLDLSSFDMSNVTNKSGMFSRYYVESLKVNDTFSTTAGDWDNDAMRLSNTAPGFISGWYNEAGEMISGNEYNAAISGQSGVLRRASADFTEATVSDVSDQIYDGTEKTPEVTVTAADGETVLTAGEDYSVVFADNTDIGTATMTLIGLGDYGGQQVIEFDIAATLTVPEDVTATVYKNKTTVADTIDDTVVIKEGYYILSDKQLFFNDTQVDIKEYKPGDNNHPFRSNATLKTKYCYRVDQLFDNVVATHTHTYLVQTIESKLNVKCKGEPGSYETVAEITIPERNYEYGDKVDIETKSYDVADYDVAATDITFDDIIFITTSGLTEDMPTALGTYTAKAQPHFSKTDLTYGLTKSFVIGKKDIAGLVQLSNEESTEDGQNKDDHIEIYLVNAQQVEQTEGAYVTDEDGKLFTIVYNNTEYTPVITLVNYVYDYTQEQYVAETVDPSNYTATLTPQTNAGTYTVTITANENSANYKGEGSFDWEITKREFANLTVVDNRAEGDDDPEDEFTDPTYSGRAVTEADFTVDNLGTTDNPGTETDNTFVYKWFEYDEESKEYVKMTDGTPMEAGDYKVEITVSNPNYLDTTVEAEFSIAQREVVITPSADNNIVYGNFIPETLTWTAENTVEGVDVDEEEVELLVVSYYDDEEPIFAEMDEILNAGEYDYYLSTDVPESRNYTFVLDPEVKFVVDKKELSKNMFSVDPLELPYNGEEQQVDVYGNDAIQFPFVVWDPFELGAYIYLMTDDDWTILNDTDKGTDAGTYTVLIVPTEDGNYKLPAEGTTTVEIGGESVTALPLDMTETVDVPDGSSVEVDLQRWTIAPLAIPDDDFEVTLDPEEATYTGEEITPTVTVTYKGETLTEDEDYTLEIEAGTFVGSYNYTVTGMGNFDGTIEDEWTITPADIYSVKVSGGTKTYDAQPVTIADFRITTKALENKAKDPNAHFQYEMVFKSGEDVVDAPVNAGTYTYELTVYDNDPENAEYVANYNQKTVTGTFQIKARKVEVYPAEGQKFEYGTSLETIEAAINAPENVEFELAEEDTITGLLPEDANDDNIAALLGGNPFTADGYNGSVGYYDIVLKDGMAVSGNYEFDYEYPVQIEVTRAHIRAEWFDLYFVETDGETTTDETAYDEDNGVTFNGKKIVVVPKDREDVPELVEGRDYTVTGDTNSYLPGEFRLVFVGKGNYCGTDEKTWKVEPNKEIEGKTIVVGAEETSGGSGIFTYEYDGKYPEYDVLPVNAPAFPELSKITYQYFFQNDEEEWAETPTRPIDVNKYKIKGNVTAKGYEINVTPAELEITRRPIQINIDANDLKGNYGQTSFTIPYTYADDAIVARDKDTVAITGEIVVNVGNGGVGEYDLDYSGVTINSDNYELVFPNNAKFVLNKSEITDECIVFGTVDPLYDIGDSSVNFTVVVDGKTLTEGTDYEVAGTTTSSEAGTYKVQVVGKGNYVGFAEATWTLAYDEEARAAAAEEIASNVTVAIQDQISAKKSGGKKRITATAAAHVKEGAEGFTITKTGFVYIAEADYTDDAALVVGGENVTEVGRSGATQYTGGLIDPTGTGIYVRAYSVVNNGKYSVEVYSDSTLLVYDDYVRYTVTVVDETGTWTSSKIDGYGTEEGQVGFTGTFVKTERPAIVATAAEAEEGYQFSHWLKNGVVASYDEVYEFRLPQKSVELEAVYVEAEEDIEAEAVLTLYATRDTYNGNNAVKFVFEHSVPADKYDIVKIGLHYGTNKLAGANTTIAGYGNVDLTVDGAAYGVNDVEAVLQTGVNAAGGQMKDWVVSYTNHNGKAEYSYAVKANVDAYVLAMGYIQAVDKTTGEEVTLYSNLISTTYNKCS